MWHVCEMAAVRRRGGRVAARVAALELSAAPEGEAAPQRGDAELGDGDAAGGSPRDLAACGAACGPGEARADVDEFGIPDEYQEIFSGGPDDVEVMEWDAEAAEAADCSNEVLGMVYEKIEDDCIEMVLDDMEMPLELEELIGFVSEARYAHELAADEAEQLNSTALARSEVIPHAEERGTDRLAMESDADLVLVGEDSSDPEADGEEAVCTDEELLFPCRRQGIEALGDADASTPEDGRGAERAYGAEAELLWTQYVTETTHCSEDTILLESWTDDEGGQVPAGPAGARAPLGLTPAGRAARSASARKGARWPSPRRSRRCLLPLLLLRP